MAIAPDSSLILIELKRGRSPREVVAQAIDYATWVEALDAEAVARIYSRFKKGGDLAKDFEARFGVGLDTEVFPYQHQIVIVAASLDASSERIVSYLSKRSVAINVLCFEVFECGAENSSAVPGSAIPRNHRLPAGDHLKIAVGAMEWRVYASIMSHSEARAAPGRRRSITALLARAAGPGSPTP